ncbi:dihydrofolate reductase family protein [Micromonospora sp. NPDC051543]|uniref:dihydrofolate reductase family protein n=1 Tax=Micromonospora sp. NPDC051543 TaxID=3364287 RepID=UPI00378DF6F6
MSGSAKFAPPVRVLSFADGCIQTGPQTLVITISKGSGIVAKVALAMMVSVDGYIAADDGGLDWMFPHVGPELQEHVMAGLQETDTILIGRETYEGMASTWPNQSNPVADRMNALPKVVFSRTLEKTEWENSRLASADVAGEVREIKRRAQGDVKVLGGGLLAQSLSELGLIDEYQLAVVPVVLGDGRPLFADPAELRLESSRRYDKGVMLNVYRPA